MHKVLIVDDEDGVRYSLEQLLAPPGYETHGARDGAEALQRMQAAPADLVILDLQMPGMSGIEVLQRIKDASPKTQVLIVTAHGDSDRVIAAMKHGAYDFIEKPFDVPRMKALVDEALEVARLMRTEVRLDSEALEDWSGDRIVGNSAAMQEVCKLVGRVAASDANVLLVGESGTGKELVARAVHQYSQRAQSSFLAVNCAAIPETLLESELFGYESGAFLGATKERRGKFEQCDGGTIFLDEIGALGFSTQAKLLRVLQEGTFERLGGEETLRTNVRLVAATNQNLEQAVLEKRFREDLYYRLKVVTITLPPLRMRLEDLPGLVQYFMAKHGRAMGRDGLALAPETLQLLQSYDWPGNVRELENALKRAILLCKGGRIPPELMAADMRTAEKPAASPAESSDLSVQVPADLERYHGKLHEMVMGELEHKLIVAVLRKLNGNQVRAAQALGISRVMLHDRIKRYGIGTEVRGFDDKPTQ